MRYLGSKKALRIMTSLIAMLALANTGSLEAKSNAKSSTKDNPKQKLVAQVAKTTQEAYSPALISVLKDIAKALSESSDYNNLTDVKQKAVVGIAISVLQSALASPQLTFNRIISNDDKTKAENTMYSETWDSGEVVVRQGNDPQAPVCHAVVSCIWAKKVNGLVNLTIAGNSNEIVDGQKLGEFIFVASGRSDIESGFDIQSQTSVNYWIGKLTQFVADTAGSPANQISTAPTPSATPAPTVSETSETATTPEQSPASEKKEINAPKAEVPPDKESSAAPSNIPVAVKQIEKAPELEEKAPRRSYLLLKAPSLKKSKSKEAAETKQIKIESKENKEDTKTEIKSSEITAPTVAAQTSTQVTETKKETEVVTTTAEQAVPGPSIQEATTETIAKETVSIAEIQPKKLVAPVEVGPSLDAILVTPDKAQAGQLITVSVVNARLVAESGVDVDFNGTVLTTGASGQIQYLVPDDSTPGPTLKIAIVGRQLATTKVVHILQPLSTPSESQPPHVDRVTNNASKFDTVTIQGHNFNGQAGNLSVTIDGKWDAQILSTSPLELKILVPEDVPAGQHSICVTNAGLKSNFAPFSLISLQVAPDAKPGQVPTKLIVRALGTAKPVAVHLRNNTPNIITIVKGNDLRIKTPGGKDNSIAVSVRLKQRGNYNIEASIE